MVLRYARKVGKTFKKRVHVRKVWTTKWVSRPRSHSLGEECTAADSKALNSPIYCYTQVPVTLCRPPVGMLGPDWEYRKVKEGDTRKEGRATLSRLRFEQTSHRDSQEGQHPGTV